jgi:8-oxo-dGTP pyrophosphatase MutT (NUDIX family)
MMRRKGAFLQSGINQLVEAHLQQPNDEESAPPSAIRRWLLEVIEETGLKATPLAKEAGLAPSTLLRALDPDHPGSLENRSIEKIVQRFGVAPPQLFRSVRPSERPAHGLSFGEYAINQRVGREVIPLNREEFPELKSNDLQTIWEIKTDILEAFGYWSGDVLVSDPLEQPRERDVVIAAIADRQGKREELILRIFDPPYLITPYHFTSTRKPLLVDNDRVSIFGVIVKSLRIRGPR